MLATQVPVTTHLQEHHIQAYSLEAWDQRRLRSHISLDSNQYRNQKGVLPR